jgi:DNA-binding NarL/FixJ family response regulator
VSWLTLPFAMLGGMALVALAASLLALLRTKWMVCAAEERSDARRALCEAAVETLQNDLAACLREFHEIQREPAFPSIAAPAKPGLNLSKRSQALRMHRRGGTPEQIAETLDLPLQQVDLLLKVHRIVIEAS